MDSTCVDQAIRTVDYMAEVYGDFHGLQSVHNIPTTWIDETAVANNASAMQALSTLVMTEPNIPAATVGPILQWVRRGGNLVVICAAGVLDEYNQPNPLLWQGLGLLQGGAGSTLPDDFASWAPAGRMNVHVAGELILAANGTGSAPELTGLTVAAYGRRCISGLPPTTAADKESTVLAKFSDGTSAVTSTVVGKGQVVYFAWLPGVSHLAAMEPSSRLPVPRAPDLVSDASKWLAAAVNLARQPPPTSTVTVNTPLVETPVLLSAAGAVVTVLDWRPHNVAWTPALVLNVTLAFLPNSVESALHGVLHWVPVEHARGDGYHNGLVVVEAPPTTHGADFVSFHRGSVPWLKTDDMQEGTTISDGSHGAAAAANLCYNLAE